MRPKHPRAAESGVGKHTARESERVQACAAGKERVTNAHPHKLAPEAAKLPEPFSFSRDHARAATEVRSRRTRRQGTQSHENVRCSGAAATRDDSKNRVATHRAEETLLALCRVVLSSR
jgi:hypothetical protein